MESGLVRNWMYQRIIQSQRQGHGARSSTQEDEVNGYKRKYDSNILFSARQCRLECDPGFVSDLTPVFDCTGGKYEPHTPNMFSCKPAVALIISDTGEREILSAEPSAKCDQMLSTIPNMNMRGHSIDLLDNQLILGATTVDSEKNWQFMSLENPRAGLLTNRWIQTRILGHKAPRNHVTFTFGKKLFYFGGDFKAQSLLQNSLTKESGEWTQLKLLKKGTINDEPFGKFTSHACSAKLDQSKFLVLGGTHIMEDGNSSVLSDVLEVDMSGNGRVQKLGKMNRPRTQHACAMISKSDLDEYGIKTFSRAILISGGVSVTDDPQTIVREVELFLLDNRESIDLSNEMQEPRFKHRMIQLGEEILALGGQTQNGTTKSIEKFSFDKNSNFRALVPGSWSTQSRSLRSNSTSSLAVTAVPESSVECNRERGCQCGVQPQERIIGGTVVGKSLDTILTCYNFPAIFAQISISTEGALSNSPARRFPKSSGL